LIRVFHLLSRGSVPPPLTLILVKANQAATRYGWNGIILGSAERAGRGGVPARIAFVSPDSKLFEVDARGKGIQVREDVADTKLAAASAECINFLNAQMNART
jgi:hypothetical protein